MSTTSTVTGVFVAIYTPFTDDRKNIDGEALKLHLDTLINAGVHGVIPGGSTGEFTALTIPERKQLLDLCVNYTDGRAKVFASIGALALADIVDLAEHAASLSVDGLMVVPPFYDAVSEAELRTIFSVVHQRTQLPIMYYHLPSVTGINLSSTQLAGLSEVGVKYVKYTAEDASGMTEMLWEHGDRLTTFVGMDTLMFYGLAAGSTGLVWGLANVVPELACMLWEAVGVQGDLKRGRELWAKLWPLSKMFESSHYAACVKTGMELRGIRTGGMREPFSLLGAEQRASLAMLLRDAGIQTISD